MNRLGALGDILPIIPSSRPTKSFVDWNATRKTPSICSMRKDRIAVESSYLPSYVTVFTHFVTSAPRRPCPQSPCCSLCNGLNAIRECPEVAQKWLNDPSILSVFTNAEFSRVFEKSAEIKPC